MPRDEATVDRIFAGNLDGLPPLSSKVIFVGDPNLVQFFFSGCTTGLRKKGVKQSI